MPDAPAGGLVAELRKEVDRSALRARNGIKHAAGIGQARVGQSAKEVVWEQDKVQLWRYANARVTRRPPILIVMSLVTRSYILDLRPGNSFIEQLNAAGFEVFMVDWGTPDAAESQNRLETYVDGYLPEAVAAALDVSGQDELTMLGYCLGGDLALLYATRQDAPLRNLMLMATPVDFDEMGLLAGLAREGRINPVELLGPDGNVPPDVIRSAFRLRRPTAEVVKYVNLWENLWNDEYVEGYQAMNRWANDHIPFPGAAAIQMVKLFIREKRLIAGSIRLGNRTMKLKAITCPVIHVMAEKDDIVPLAAAAPLLGLLGSRDKTELRLPAGHVAMVAGRSAVKTNIPRVIEWIDGHSRPVSRRRK